MNRRLAAVGLASGILSGLLGIGGGIIVVPGLIWAAGLGRHKATGTSLLVILPPAAVATLVYALAPGGAFDLEASAILVVGSLRAPSSACAPTRASPSGACGSRWP